MDFAVTVAGLLVGASLTLVAQAVLQLVVIPRVESRKRYEDRWEKDVRELGDVLASSRPAAARSLRLDVGLFHSCIDEWRRNPGDPRLGAVRDAADRAQVEFAQLHDYRIPLLVERIASHNRRTPSIARFSHAAQMFEAQSVIAQGWYWQLFPTPLREPEHFESVMDAYDVHAKTLFDCVLELSRGATPRRAGR